MVDTAAVKAAAKAKAEADAKKTVIASSFEDGKNNTPENTIDGNPGTYWSTDEKNPWIRYTLEKEIKLGQIGITWYQGSERVYPFEVEFSFDAQVWQQVYQGKSRQEDGMETYEFDSATANYVRIRCHGNNVTEFSAIHEVRIDGLKPQQK